MHGRCKPSQAQRIVVVALIAGLLLPAVGRAEEEAPAEPPPAVGRAEEEGPAELPPAETHWYDGPVRAANVTVDVLVIRPLAVVTLAVGSILFVPAAVLTIPNGRDSIQEAWERFVKEPGQGVWGRPLGEF